MKYPAAPRSDTADDYHGTRVADPFRTLEDPKDPATIAWTDAENALTESYLNRPERVKIESRLRELFNYARTSIPEKRGSRLFFSKNEGLQNQPVYFVQDGTSGARRVLIDPNTLSADGTVALSEHSISDDGKLFAYSISKSGSDWREIRIREVDSGRDLDDRLEWVKFSSLDWTPDNRGFFYSQYPTPGTVPPGDEHYFQKLRYHAIGTPQSADLLVYERPGEKGLSFDAEPSHEGDFVIISVFKGSSDDSEIYVAKWGSNEAPRALFTGFAHAYIPIRAFNQKLYLLTNDGAARRKIIEADLATGSKRDLVPEGKDYIEDAAIYNRTIVTHSLRNASSTLRLFRTDGAPAGEVTLPGIGKLSDLEGGLSDPEMFLTYESYISAPTNYRYDFTQAKLTVHDRSNAPIDSSQYETRQVWYPSKDGTRVSMFINQKKGLKRNPGTPVFLYGYGGFNIALTPSFNPVHFWFLEQGGIFAVANLRGGAEYGEEWHQGGMLGKKQNVFDDFAAAAEWLIREGYTSREKLAVSGRSNGGLLAAATLTQRPDLMQAAVVQVPVVDMLRYHRFTVARFWIPEYGSSEDPAEFKFLYAYSPLHNVRDGARYPATLVTTADTDDRVDPGPAKKFAARLQEAQAGDAPVLIRIEKKAGHSSGSVGGGGKPVSKLITEWADIWTFVGAQLGML